MNKVIRQSMVHQDNYLMCVFNVRPCLNVLFLTFGFKCSHCHIIYRIIFFFLINISVVIFCP